MTVDRAASNTSGRVRRGSPDPANGPTEGLPPQGITREGRGRETAPQQGGITREGGGGRRAGGPAAAPCAPTGRARRGYTLIEVLLSLTLASLVLLAVGMAVDFQLRVVDRSRGDVEEAQLARVLLRRIADDLRCAVTKDPLGMAELVGEFESAADEALEGEGSGAETSTEGATDSASGATEGTGSGGAGSMESDEGESEEADESELDEMEGTDETGESDDSAESTASQSTPGVYGESDWLQVDVAILPRLDQFDADTTSTEGSSLVDRSSDVKTVTYYVVESEDETGYAADGTPTGGLVRRVLDRAVSLWSSEIGQIDEDSDVTPLAPEVAAIAFRYGNGTEWVDAWDSQEEETLPLAVEVTLTIRPIRDPGGLVSSDQLAADEDETQWFTYTRIIHLLAAEAASADETFEETEETTETSESESTETGGETSR